VREAASTTTNGAGASGGGGGVRDDRTQGEEDTPDDPRNDGDDPDGSDRRTYERFPTRLSVDYSSGDTFLFSYIQNISEMGIFVRSDDPLPVGTHLHLRFGTGEDPPLELSGEVVWINPIRPGGDNPNPGMGVRFSELTPDLRERIVELVRTIAYLRTDAEN
jgi:type IV pilus assembly protein PilZ